MHTIEVEAKDLSELLSALASSPTRGPERRTTLRSFSRTILGPPGLRKYIDRQLAGEGVAFRSIRTDFAGSLRHLIARAKQQRVLENTRLEYRADPLF